MCPNTSRVADPNRAVASAPITPAYLEKNGATFYDLTPGGLICASFELAALKGKLYGITYGMGLGRAKPVEQKDAAKILTRLEEVSKEKNKLVECKPVKIDSSKVCFDMTPESMACVSKKAVLDKKTNEIYLVTEGRGGAHWQKVTPNPCDT